MALTVFRVTLEQQEIETCGFHHAKVDTQRHDSMTKIGRSVVDRSD
jgi:hypothetical protein